MRARPIFLVRSSARKPEPFALITRLADGRVCGQMFGQPKCKVVRTLVWPCDGFAKFELRAKRLSAVDSVGRDFLFCFTLALSNPLSLKTCSVVMFYIALLIAHLFIFTFAGRHNSSHYGNILTIRARPLAVGVACKPTRQSQSDREFVGRLARLAELYLDVAASIRSAPGSGSQAREGQTSESDGWRCRKHKRVEQTRPVRVAIDTELAGFYCRLFAESR